MPCAGYESVKNQIKCKENKKTSFKLLAGVLRVEHTWIKAPKVKFSSINKASILTEAHKKAGILRAGEILQSDAQMGKKVIFSDETKFKFYTPDGLKRIGTTYKRESKWFYATLEKSFHHSLKFHTSLLIFQYSKHLWQNKLHKVL